MKIFFIFYLIFSFKAFGGMLTQEELDLIGGSNIQYKPGVCDPKTIQIEHLDHEYVTKVPVNEQLYLSCKRPYGYRTKDKSGKTIIESSFYVMCQKDGTFTGLKTCEETCDASAVLKSSSNYDLPRTKNLTTGGSVSGSKLVMNGDELEIFCFEGYMVKDLSNDDTAVRSFRYTCGASDPAKRRILECVKQPVKFNSAPPKSKYKEGDKIPKNCRVTSIATLNATITGGTAVSGNTVPESIKPGQTLDYTCNKGLFTTTAGIAANPDLGYKITKKFTVTCDPDGGGNFIGVKGCSPRCNASELKMRSSEKNLETVQKIEIVKTTGNPINQPIGTIEQKNEVTSSTDPLFVDINSRVKVTCKPGYQIRKTFQDHYYANCLAGGEFDIGKEAQVCEVEIKPCKNSEIDIAGALLTNNSATVGSGSKDVTQIGSTLKVACKGGPEYNDNGTKPMPRCVYDPVTKTGKWENNHTTFFCYDGCIFNDSANNTAKIMTGESHSVSKNSLVYLRTTKIEDQALVGKDGIFGSTPRVKPGARTNISPLNAFYNSNTKTIPAYQMQESNNYAIMDLSGKSVSPFAFGILFHKISTVYICESRQDMPVIFDFTYKIAKVSQITNTGSTSDRRVAAAFISDINGSKPCPDGQNGGACIKQMLDEYKLISKNINGVIEKNIIKTRMFFKSKKNDPDNIKCNSIMDEFIPVPNYNNCEGAVHQYNDITCGLHTKFTPAFIEEATCRKEGGSQLKLGRSQNKDSNPTVSAMRF